MRVHEVMSDAKCCKPDDTVRDCARMMKDEDIGFVPICDQAGKPIGAITDRDIAIRVVAEGRKGDEKAEGCMSRDIVACRVTDDVRDVERLMREHRVSRVMACDDQGKLQGVVSLQDLAHAESEHETGRTLNEVKSEQPSVH